MTAQVTQHTPTRRLVSPVAAADYAGVSHWTIRRRISDGSLTGYRAGPRLIRVDLDEVDRWMVAIPTVGNLPTGGAA